MPLRSAQLLGPDELIRAAAADLRGLLVWEPVRRLNVSHSKAYIANYVFVANSVR